jgi:TRAP-type mannitol/chloroaromatic compound transport system substrate-binding protein
MMLTNKIARTFLAIAVAGGWALGVGVAAEAQDKPVRWQMASGYPSSMVQLGTLGVSLSKKLARVSGGNVQLKFNEPGALVPALQVFDAVSNGSVAAGWSSTGLYTGKDVAFAFYSAVPFGPEAGEFLAWMYHGGGLQLWDELHAKYNIKALPCGATPPEASGWFRKEIKTLDDLKGLKMRFFGLGARAIQKLGVQTQLIAGGEIFQALQFGTIDATEFAMPAVDLKLGFYQVAKHYYFPGWHQPATLYALFIHDKRWAELSDAQKAQFEMVCGDNIREGIAEGEALQFGAMEELRAKGVTFHKWPPEFIAAFEKAWNEVAAEEAAKSPLFKKALDSLTAFRAKYKVWRDYGYYSPPAK